jgi:hypothetical protein
MKPCIRSLIVAVLAVGCTTNDTDTLTSEHQGLAEVHVDAAPLAASITRVTLQAGAESQDLVLNPATGTFDGTLILPSGTQSVVASAFSGDTLVGQSQPTSVDIQAGIVTRILLRILDLTVEGPSIYGPIFDSLSYPTTTEAEASATFTISVVAPVGDPVTYAWASDCADSTFSAPDAATTSWSKAAEGACTINVTATSNGFSIMQSFGIVVFPAGSGRGAVTVNSVFVTAPMMFLSLPTLGGCLVFPGGNASCSDTIASPTTAPYQVSVFNWGSSAPGTIELSDNCGGRFGTDSRNAGDRFGSWLPPVAGGLCILTARAVNGDGLASTLSAAILVRAGGPATAQPPVFSGSLANGCFFQSSGVPADCGLAQAGGSFGLFGNMFWADGHPGSLTITDDCGGGAQSDPNNLFFFDAPWTLPSEPGRICTTTVRATNLEGVSSDAVARYQLVDPTM